MVRTTKLLIAEVYCSGSNINSVRTCPVREWLGLE